MNWESFDYPGVDKATVSDALILVNITLERDRLLAGSDWTQLPDSPVDKTVWATYRQQLRDLPASAPPRQIVFPTPPA